MFFTLIWCNLVKFKLNNLFSFNFPPVYSFFLLQEWVSFFSHIPNFSLWLTWGGNWWCPMRGCEVVVLFHLGPLVHSFLLFLDVPLLLEKRGVLVGMLCFCESHTLCIKHFPSFPKKIFFSNLFLVFDTSFKFKLVVWLVLYPYFLEL